MSSSCMPTGLRLDLDMVKAAASPGAHSSPLRPVHSSPSSTLSEASNASSSATSVSLKRARAPRKRPNQAYNEAAALLASIHPSVFPVKKSPKTAPPRPPSSRQLSGLAAALDASSSDLLPPLPVLADSAFLLRDIPAPSPLPQPQSPSAAKNCSSPAPVSSAFRDFRDPAPSPASPDTVDVNELGEIDFDDDGFDAESILDVEEAAAAAEGLDGIMGSLTVESNSTAATTSDDSILSSSGIHPYLRSLMVVGLAGRFELGLGSRHGARPNLNRALKRRDDDGAWWMWPAVPVKDLTVAPPTPPASNAAVSQPQPAAAPEKNKSKKKKVVKVEKVMMGAKGKEELLPSAKCKEEEADGDGDAESAPVKAPKTGLGLKLDADEVLKAWSDRGSMFAEGSAPESPTSVAEARAKLSDMDLFPENEAGAGAGGVREASVLRYKEKRRTRLFSKKIRYQGRFVRSPSLLRQALEEES
ncbi:protein CHLOROPLAST IMPORT APPARATUS 2 isoform X2 [Zea mays]|uniref:Protein CHLOROPLAST IMPORT APPARATUS 2 n=1 Tax=Zea mays TaxID=4577 RepID=A0A1D6H0V3_MAIZE|nr:protein CHLOROPLAST IMPORT APPARATUS 2 isoform X2 [Zea mays]AQK68522.1 Protein CHLOROPLAST IMPORT APPARATUS 2 [Zea mays]|eukprot:XP_008645244.1 protein CHLOROPLAST IMPORT APPARATUS 2 isoform X2 [Zea mays]